MNLETTYECLSRIDNYLNVLSGSFVSEIETINASVQESFSNSGNFIHQKENEAHNKNLELIRCRSELKNMKAEVDRQIMQVKHALNHIESVMRGHLTDSYEELFTDVVFQNQVLV